MTHLFFSWPWVFLPAYIYIYKKKRFKTIFHELLHPAWKGHVIVSSIFFGPKPSKNQNSVFWSSFILGTLKRYLWFYRKENKVLHGATVLGHFSTTQEFNLKKLDQFFKVTIHFRLGHWKSTYRWGIVAEPFWITLNHHFMFSFLHVNSVFWGLK